jgi:hypothetical protein
MGKKSDELRDAFPSSTQDFVREIVRRIGVRRGVSHVRHRESDEAA